VRAAGRTGWWLGVLCGVTGAGGVWAFDAVHVDSILPDEAFFRAATCGALPGKPCAAPAVIWPRTGLTLTVIPPPPEKGLIFRLLLSLSVDYAIDRINAAGSGLTITRSTDPAADIRLSVTDAVDGTRMPDEPGLSGSGVMGVGYTTVWSGTDNRISDASILISASISPTEIVSVVLEEIFQATGPLFDIDGPAYEGVSILSQNSNATVTIAGQDARLLRWLYPPEP
jgi:hypothetical protein